MGMHSKAQSDFLDPKELRLRRDPPGTVRATVGKAEYVGVTAKWLFPFSKPGRFLALNDSEGKEIGVVRDPEALSSQTRQVLLEEAEKAHYAPRISKIKAITEAFGVTEWEVETNEGSRRFQVRGGRESIRVVGCRVVVTDVDDNRFEIGDLRALDRKSQALLDQYL